VFEGGFTLEAAEEVLDLAAWPEAGWAMDVVEALVDKSLVRMWVPEAGSEARFGMFASLQEYARERLREGPGGEALTRRAEERHGAYFARFGTDEAIDALDLRGGVARRRALVRELDNLTAACRRAMAREDGETAAATFQAARAVLGMRGPFLAGLGLGRQVLGMTRLSPRGVGHVLRSVGWFSQLVGRMEEARSSYERSLALFREVGDRRAECSVLHRLGVLHGDQGRMEVAGAFLMESLVMSRAAGDRHAEGVALESMAMLRGNQSRPEEARELYEQALAILREIGDRHEEGITLGNLGLVHRGEGRYDQARAHFDRAIAIAREAGDRRVEGVFLTNLINLDVQQGRLEQARGHGGQALAMVREIGDRRVEAYALIPPGIRIGAGPHRSSDRTSAPVKMVRIRP
jgi:tetratricopeptide (TPR) repeat protein